MFKVKYGDILHVDLGLNAKTRPNIPISERNIEIIEDKTLATSLTRDYGTYKDKEIEISYNFVDREDFNIKSLTKYFDKDYFFIKLSPINVNEVSESNNMGNGIIKGINLV